MSAVPSHTPPPPAQETRLTKTPTLTAGVNTQFDPYSAFLTNFGSVFAIVFAVGAAVLSYKTFGSAPWAMLDFFFPYLYYPYYAFVLHGSAPPAPTTAVFGGKRSVLNLLKMKW